MARHHPTSSLIRTNHWKILKNPQNGFSKGIFSSVPTDGAQMKLIKRKFGHTKGSGGTATFTESSIFHVLRFIKNVKNELYYFNQNLTL